MASTLIFMRHAKSDHGDPSLSDHDRPLNRRGRRDAPRMAQWLADQGCVPTRVLCSTAVRTRETLDLMCQVWRRPPETEFCDSLYLAGCESILWTVESHHGDASPLLVLGHNPGMSVVSSVLAGCALEMPTAAIAVLSFPESIKNLGAESDGVLTHFITPKTLGD